MGNRLPREEGRKNEIRVKSVMEACLWYASITFLFVCFGRRMGIGFLGQKNVFSFAADFFLFSAVYGYDEEQNSIGRRKMKSKKVQFLIGCILLCIGILSLFTQKLQIDFQVFFILFLGVSFLFLYADKRKIWALILGLVTIVYACSSYFCKIPYIGESLVTALLFMIPGVICILEYKKGRSNKYLLPGVFAFFIGIYILLMPLPVFRAIAGALLFLVLSACFLTIYFLGRKNMGQWTLFIGLFNLVLGLFLLIGCPLFSDRFNIMATAGSVFLIAVSILLIIRSLKKKS